MKNAFFAALCLLFLAIGCLPRTAAAQRAATDTTRNTTRLLLNYWGTLNNSTGLRVGLERTHLQVGKYSVHSSLSLVGNRKAETYFSAGILVGSSLRKTGKKGLFIEHGLVAGYLGSRYDFDFYSVNADGKVVNIGRRWQSSFILGYSVALGYDFAKKTKADWQVFLKPGVYYRAPNFNNVFYLNNYSVEVGATFRPKWLGKR